MEVRPVAGIPQRSILVEVTENQWHDLSDVARADLVKIPAIPRFCPGEPQGEILIPLKTPDRAPIAERMETGWELNDNQEFYLILPAGLVSRLDFITNGGPLDRDLEHRSYFCIAGFAGMSLGVETQLQDPECFGLLTLSAGLLVEPNFETGSRNEWTRDVSLPVNVCEPNTQVRIFRMSILAQQKAESLIIDALQKRKENASNGPDIANALRISVWHFETVSVVINNSR